MKDNSLRLIKKYSYKRAEDNKKEEIAADTVFTKSTASVVNNDNTNKSYPVSYTHLDVYKRQL